MKKHEKIIPLLKQALLACGEDYSMAEVKKAIKNALQACAKIVDKKEKKEQAADKFRKEAAEKQKLWWEKIKNNVGKMKFDKLPEQDNGPQPNT